MDCRVSGGLCSWDFSGESTGVGCHVLLQELSSCYQTILEKNGNPLQYCLGNPMDRGAWWATVTGVTKELDTTEQLNNNTSKSLTLGGREKRASFSHFSYPKCSFNLIMFLRCFACNCWFNTDTFHQSQWMTDYNTGGVVDESYQSESSLGKKKISGKLKTSSPWHLPAKHVWFGPMKLINPF